MRASSSAASARTWGSASMREQGGLRERELELSRAVAEGRAELARVAVRSGVDFAAEDYAEADADAAGESERALVPAELDEGEQEIA